VLDGVQGGVCANPPKSASNAGWRGVRQMRVFNVPWPISRLARTPLGFGTCLGFAQSKCQGGLDHQWIVEVGVAVLAVYPQALLAASG
jgi:hypothetical protein